jgi:hypothetical protein
MCKFLKSKVPDMPILAVVTPSATVGIEQGTFDLPKEVDWIGARIERRFRRHFEKPIICQDRLGTNRRKVEGKRAFSPAGMDNYHCWGKAECEATPPPGETPCCCWKNRTMPQNLATIDAYAAKRGAREASDLTCCCWR